MSSSAPADCLFCRIVAGEIPSTLVGERPGAIAIRDIAPVAPVHVLVLPRRHLLDASELASSDAELLGEIFELANEVAKSEGVHAGGFRLVANVGEDGGRTIEHLHFHLLGGRSMGWPPG